MIAQSNEYSLSAFFMVSLVLPERAKVAQQARAFDLDASDFNLKTRPIRLIGDWAVGAKEIAGVTRLLICRERVWRLIEANKFNDRCVERRDIVNYGQTI